MSVHQEPTYRTFILDWETTGLNPPVHDILEIAVLFYEPNKSIESLVPLKNLVQYEYDIPDTSSAIDGITSDMNKFAPPFTVVWQRILSYITFWLEYNYRVLIVDHNSKFDICFLQTHHRRHNIPFPY